METTSGTTMCYMCSNININFSLNELMISALSVIAKNKLAVMHDLTYDLIDDSDVDSGCHSDMHSSDISSHNGNGSGGLYQPMIKRRRKCIGYRMLEKCFSNKLHVASDLVFVYTGTVLDDIDDFLLDDAASKRRKFTNEMIDDTHTHGHSHGGIINNTYSYSCEQLALKCPTCGKDFKGDHCIFKCPECGYYFCERCKWTKVMDKCPLCEKDLSKVACRDYEHEKLNRDDFQTDIC